MDELEAMFDGVDGLKEDAKEYGVAALGAVGANVAFGAAQEAFYKMDFMVKSRTTADGFLAKNPWVQDVAPAVTAIGLGLAAARYAPGGGMLRRSALSGAAVGLISRGLSGLILLGLEKAAGTPTATWFEKVPQHRGLGATSVETRRSSRYQNYLGGQVERLGAATTERVSRGPSRLNGLSAQRRASLY